MASSSSPTGPPAAASAWGSPPSWPKPNASHATSPTPSTPAIWSSIPPASGVGGPWEATPWTMTSAVIPWSMRPLTLSLVVAPSVPNAATRVSPRVRAKAVAAVRRVLRPALVAASFPTAPKGAPMTRPIPPAMGLARAGITRKLPTIRAAAPTPTVIAPLLVVSCQVPMRASMMPLTTASSPTDVRQPPPASEEAAPTRMPWTGATRPARRAGAQAENTVTTKPSTSGVTTAIGVSARAPEGIPRSKASSTAKMTRASPKPARTPIAEPTRPVSAASASTDRVSCPRVAPIARNRASSRNRCATSMEKVL